MKKKFHIHSSFKPAGDQPKAIQALVEGVEHGEANQTLLGVTGSGKTFTMVHTIARSQRPALVLVHNKTLAAQLYGELREFLPDNAVEYFVSYYDYYQPEAYVPASDTFIDKDASLNEHIQQMRLSATKALMEREDAVIVASVSCIYGLGDPELYFSMILHLSRGERVSQRDIIRQLTDMQYKRNDVELLRATYRVRGDVIDIFPAESDQDALRVELFDDEIDFSLEPSEYRPAVITNLFVWNNYMHDVWYNYGFDETSGNFQEANYGRFVDDGSLFGPDGDSVNAEAQDGSELAAPTLNNANMATSMDGSNPRMQMFLWGAAPFGDFLEVISPSDVEGSYFASRFPFVDIPRIEDGEDQIRANIIVVEDDGTPYLGDDGGTPGLSTESNDGCTAYLNAADIEGIFLSPLIIAFKL